MDPRPLISMSALISAALAQVLVVDQGWRASALTRAAWCRLVGSQLFRTQGKCFYRKSSQLCLSRENYKLGELLTRSF